MTKRLTIFSLTALILIFTGSYFYYQQRPEQKILKTVEKFLENIEHRKISTRRNSDLREALRALLAPQINLRGKHPIPSGKMQRDEVIAEIENLHLLTNFIKMTPLEHQLQLFANKAQVYQTVEIRGSSGIGAKQYKAQETWELVIDLEKEHQWHITGISAKKM